MQAVRERFLAFWEKNKTQRFVVCTHRQADLDSFTSAYAVARAFPNSTLAMPDDPNQSVQTMLEKWEVRPVRLSALKPGDYDGLVVCDTSTYTLLPDARKWRIVAIVDHHRAEGRDMKSEHDFWDEQSPATAELVANMLPEIDERTAHALALGIISDTARFKSARTSTFATLAQLMEKAKATYAELLVEAEPELPSDLKISVLKAFQRLEYRIVGEYIVVTSEVGSGESAAASLLSEAADVAFVASWETPEQETHISSRARKHVRVPLHEVMKSVAVQFGGNGGGHPKAAGAAVKTKPKEALAACVEMFGRKLQRA